MNHAPNDASLVRVLLVGLAAALTRWRLARARISAGGAAAAADRSGAVQNGALQGYQEPGAPVDTGRGLPAPAESRRCQRGSDAAPCVCGRIHPQGRGPAARAVVQGFSPRGPWDRRSRPTRKGPSCLLRRCVVLVCPSDARVHFTPVYRAGVGVCGSPSF